MPSLFQEYSVARRDSGWAELTRPQVDVVVGHFWTSHEQIERAANGIPVVVLDRTDHLPGMHSVELDLRSGIEEAVRVTRHRNDRFELLLTPVLRSCSLVAMP
ncbi:hypothetical protein AB0J35_32050 [Nonomuraea angiospora]|uniref:hypothetical protein n=1 Tax=Nonomuraea angiospora TaxID=46172 RepID=UPI00341F72C9